MKRLLSVLGAGFGLMAGGCAWTSPPAAPDSAPAPVAQASRQPVAVPSTEPLDTDRPPFLESLALFRWGTALPDLPVKDANGAQAMLHQVLQGKANILALAGAINEPGNEGVFERLETLASRYKGQGLKVVVVSMSTPEQVKQWSVRHPHSSFSLFADPAGPMPTMSREEYDALNDAQKEAFGQRMGEHVKRTVITQISRPGAGFLTPPQIIMLDADRKLIGWTHPSQVGSLTEGLGNLLLRTGLQLQAMDQPKRVYTHEESKDPERPQEAPVTLRQVGTQAPDFTVMDGEGREVKLSDYRGKVVVLDFWATWCGPCMASMPHVQEIAETYKDQGVVVLAVCTQDSRKSFERWVRKNGPTLSDVRFASDPGERSEERMSRTHFGVFGIPQYFVIDRAGKVVANNGGYIAGEKILDADLAKAGITVPPEVLAKAAADQEKRRALGNSGMAGDDKSKGGAQSQPAATAPASTAPAGAVRAEPAR